MIYVNSYLARSLLGLDAAAVDLGTALDAFAALEARYDLGRTHVDLARLARARGQDAAAAAHLGEALDLFRLLRIPAYVTRIRELAKELGAPLPEGPTRDGRA